MRPHSFGPPGGPRGPRRADGGRDPVAGAGDRVALWVLLGVHGVLLGALVLAGWTLLKYLPNMPLSPWQKAMFEIGIAAALVAFTVRAALLWRRLRHTRST